MPIERGREWGHAGGLPDDAPVATGDAELASLAAAGEAPVVGVVGGDVARTLGIDGRREPVHRVELDLMSVTITGRPPMVAAAHVVVGRPLGGRVVAVMNAAWIGHRNIAPRAHPGDGLLDVVDAELAWRERIQAWQRSRTGTHVPHPGITVKRLAEYDVRFPGPVPVRIDGELVGRSALVHVSVRPAAVTVAY